jgi:hypothetical protein
LQQISVNLLFEISHIQPLSDDELSEIIIYYILSEYDSKYFKHFLIDKLTSRSFF